MVHRIPRIRPGMCDKGDRERKDGTGARGKGLRAAVVRLWATNVLSQPPHAAHTIYLLPDASSAVPRRVLPFGSCVRRGGFGIAAEEFTGSREFQFAGRAK